MRSLMPIRCPVLFKGILLTTVVLYHDTSRGAMAACTTSLPDATPAASETFTIPSGECAGNINLAAGNDGVTIKFLSGAEPFQAGKSIVLPLSGVIVGLKIQFTGVNWGAVSQRLFSYGPGGDSMPKSLELKGADVEFIGSSFTSSVSNPIGLPAKLTTSSRYTISSSTISVTGGGAALGFSSDITDSTISISSGSALMATGSDSAFGINFIERFARSTLSITGSVQATTTFSAWATNAYAIKFGLFADSTLVMRDGSVVQATSNNSNAYGIYIGSPYGESTLCATDDSVLKATGGTGSYTVSPGGISIESQCPATSAAGSLSESSADGNGASSVTAAALGLLTMVLAAF